MTKVLIAPDKFKDSLSAHEVCLAISSGFKKYNSTIEIISHPLADGGDGSIDILANYLPMSLVTIEVNDPLGRLIKAKYFISNKIAFIEVASASGLVLLAEPERNPMLTSTVGTGQMIADALKKGANKVYLFLGGSATNDAAMGIASCLGFEFLDKNNAVLKPIGENLIKVASIRSAKRDCENIEFVLLCDVQNPMFGKEGAAHIYAEQKGATAEMIEVLDMGLQNFAQVVEREFKVNIAEIPGGGAAGGIAAGLLGLLNAEIQSGIDTIIELTNFEKHLSLVDVVISGEGKLDEQSLQGKVINGVSKLCKEYEKPLVLFVGKNDLSIDQSEKISSYPVNDIVALSRDTQDAMENAKAHLEELAYLFAVRNGLGSI